MSMGIGTAEKTAERVLRGGHALLDAWLAALNQVDNPMRRRAAKFRREQRPRRDIPPNRVGPGEVGLLLHFNNQIGLFDQEARAKCAAPSALSFRFRESAEVGI